ncbi:hypothetical protein [Clostridium felsineum]|uniref:hypothetical protein n=1 Tax=Clostridium felsineum TaxID=36839 RepID=UPI001FA87345|nr:hypothetical protein [Clostridium felsineum]
MIQIADEILVVISKMDSFIKELRKGIDKTEAVKNDIKREQRRLNNGLSSDIIKAVQGDVTKLISSSKSILDIMVRMSINLNTAKTEFINADKNSFELKALHIKRIYRGEEPSKENTGKANLLPNAKLEKDILRWVFEQAIKSKIESDIVKSKLKVGDFDGASIELTGMDVENVLNALTMGEAGAAIEGFQTLFKLGSKGYKLLKVGITGAKEALSKLTVASVALAFAGAKGFEQIEETAQNLKKEEGIIKTALESAKRKLDDLYKIVYDGESGGKEKVSSDAKSKVVGQTEKYTENMRKYIIVPEDGFQALIERKYIEIRKLGFSDVKTVSKNTGLPEQDIIEMKKHLFLDTHDLSIRGNSPKRLYFQADPDIAYAWQKAQNGELTQLQKNWFKELKNHEITEKKSMDKGMLLRDPSTWNSGTEQFTTNPLKNAHDKANLTSPNPTNPFPGYDSASDFIKNMDKDINY